MRIFPGIIAGALLIASLGAPPASGDQGASPPRPTVTGRDGAPMVYVPAGRFIMGDDNVNSDERPLRRVYLDAFYIDKYPVTNARYKKFGTTRDSFGPGLLKDSHPVVGVTWYQADGYCRSIGKRLPTEAEWEKTERGTDGRTFPWGEGWDSSKVVWLFNSGTGTHPVARNYLTHESPYGAVDMEGNVWGWMADWYKGDYYQTAPDRNPKGPPSGKKRALRGCSWQSDDIKGFRAALRNSEPPDYWSHVIGFRCASSGPPRS